jgi:glycyl-tRNA synthetase
MEKIVALCKRRGFVYPGSEIYGGLANTYDYGPLGVELKNNIKNLWWERFVHQRTDIVGLDSTLLMNPKVWEASGHLQNFSDPLVECKKCNNRYRADHLIAEASPGKALIIPADPNLQLGILIKSGIKCPYCQAQEWSNPKQFNLMFKTFIGPAEETANITYFRPETAQGMFVDFQNILDSTRIKLPFGIAQIGRAFRNEVTPGNFIFRLREFEMMEIEYFIQEKDWEKYFDIWRQEILNWIKEIGVNLKKVHEAEIPEGERAHYSKRTIDFEYEFPFGQKELYGLAYRTDFDLRNHEKFSGKNLKYKDPETDEEFWPHVIEPTFGVDRTVLAILSEGYTEEEGRVVLKLNPKLAPYKVAVFPLLANKPQLVELARKIYSDLKKDFMVAWDERGNIGKRYFAQDEIGTPWCVTVDFDSLEKDDVTVRDRDTMKQERIKIAELKDYFREKMK